MANVNESTGWASAASTASLPLQENETIITRAPSSVYSSSINSLRSTTPPDQHFHIYEESDELQAEREGEAAMAGGDSALDWTLKFKHAKTTIVLNIAPTMPFNDVRKLLIGVMNDTSVDQSTFCGKAIPDDPKEIVLARAVDQMDLSQGWVRIEAPGNENSGRNNLDCPQGIGLKSGDAIAFLIGSADGQDAEDGEDWGVVLPKFEDEAAAEGA